MGEVIAMVLAAALWATGFFFLGIAFSYSSAEATMQQAFERGYAVQCIGKTGYHWECGE